PLTPNEEKRHVPDPHRARLRPLRPRSPMESCHRRSGWQSRTPQLCNATGNRTVGMAIRDYLAALRTERGALESTVVTNRHRLMAILRVRDDLDRLLTMLTPAAC